MGTRSTLRAGLLIVATITVSGPAFAAPPLPAEDPPAAPVPAPAPQPAGPPDATPPAASSFGPKDSPFAPPPNLKKNPIDVLPERRQIRQVVVRRIHGTVEFKLVVQREPERAQRPSQSL